MYIHVKPGGSIGVNCDREPGFIQCDSFKEKFVVINLDFYEQRTVYIAPVDKTGKLLEGEFRDSSNTAAWAVQ